MTENEHILTCLAEECAEVAKNVSKALRFGLDDKYPEDGLPNRELIRIEMIDLLATYEMASERNLVPEICTDTIRGRMKTKQARVLKWMDYAQTQGTITP